MPTITYAALNNLDTPGRAIEGALIIDCRYQNYASWPPPMMAPLFAGRYLHVPALGNQSCTDGSADAIPQIVSWSEGLAQVQAVHTPGQPIIVLCGCPEVNGRSHRRDVARALAAALHLVDDGALQ